MQANSDVTKEMVSFLTYKESGRLLLICWWVNMGISLVKGTVSKDALLLVYLG
jgi:hypothetical protein